MEPGLEHSGKQDTRTGTSGGRRPWTGTSGEEAAQDPSVRGYGSRRIGWQRAATRST